MPTCFQYLAIYEYRRASLWTRLIPDLPRRGKGVRRRSEAGAKLYFLSSRHVLGIQDSRIPRVFKDSSPSFVCEAATKGGGREGGTRASPKGSNPSGSHARVLVPVYKMNTWKLDAAVLHTYKGVWPRVHTCARARGRNRKPRSSRITTEQYAPSLFHLLLAHPRWHEDTPSPPEWTHVWPTQAEYTQAILYLLNDARYLEEAMRVYPGVSARPIVASLNVQREALSIVDGWTRFSGFILFYMAFLLPSIDILPSFLFLFVKFFERWDFVFW